MMDLSKLRQIMQKNPLVKKYSKYSSEQLLKMASGNKDKKEFMDFAGMLTETEGNKLLKLVETGRRDGSSKKKYLINWTFPQK